jgi:hypothetical protein
MTGADWLGGLMGDQQHTLMCIPHSAKLSSDQAR